MKITSEQKIIVRPGQRIHPSENMNILVLDSDKTRVAQTCEILVQNGTHQILIATDRKSLDQTLAVNTVDIIVSEIKLHAFSIYELLELSSVKNKIPVIAFSQEQSEEEVLQLIQSGVTEIVSQTKPRTLFHTVKRAFDEAQLKKNYTNQIGMEKYALVSESMSAILDKINNTVHTEFGEKYFSNLTNLLYKLGAANAILIGRYVKDQKSIKTISYRIDGVEQDNLHYPLLDTPCENVIQKGVCVYPDNIQKLFPKDADLVKLQAKSYVGAPIFGRTNEPIGIVVLVDSKPISDAEEKKVMLQFISEIASNEMQRLAADELLIQSEKKYREVVENQSELIVRWKPSGKIVFTNRSYQKFHELSETELAKKSVYDLVKDRNRFEQKISLLSLENPRVSDTHISTTPSGKPIWYEWTDQAFFDSVGNITEIQSIGRDVSIRIEAEAEIKTKEEFSHSILSAIQDHIAVIDQNGTILSTNKSWKLFSSANEGIFNRTDVGSNYFAVCENAIRSGDENARSSLDGIKSVINGERTSFEMEYPCHSDTDRRWFIMRVSPLQGIDGGAVITHTDISEKKNKDQELLISYEEIMHTQQINQALINGESYKTLSDHILEGLDDIANVQRSRIYLYDKTKHELILHAEKSSAELTNTIEKETGIQIGMAVPKLKPGGLFQEVITEQNIILTHDPDQIKTLIAEHADNDDQKKFVDWVYDLVGIRTFGLYPLKRGSDVIGLLTISTPYILNYKEKSTVFRFAQRASLVISRKMEQDELIQSEEKFKAISNYTSNWETWIGTDGKPTWINPGVYNLIGYTAEELLAMPNFYEQIIYKEDFEKVAHKLHDALTNKTDGDSLESRCNHKDGSLRWFSISWKQVYDTSGKWLGIRSSGGDITDLKTQKQELFQRTQDLREIQRIAKLGEWIWHIESDMIELSDQLSEMIGLNSVQTELSRERLFYLVHPDSHQDLEDALAKAKNNAETGDVEIRLNSLSGEDKYLLLRARNQIEAEIKKGRVKGSALDITELKTSFLKSKEHQQKFQKIFESIQDVYFQVNTNGAITLLSPSVKDLTGYEPDELIGKPITTLFSSLESDKLKPDGVEIFEKSEQFEATLISKQNEEIIVSIHLSQYAADKDSVLITQGIMRNITERKRQEKSLENQRKRLLEIVKLNTQIIETSDHFYYILQVNESSLKNAPLKYISIQVSDILGMSELELLNQENRWMSLIHPEDREKVDAAFDKIIQDKKPQRVSYRIKHKLSGQQIWVDDYACPLLNDQNEVVEVFGSVKDVSERVNSIIKITAEKKQSMAYQHQLLSSQLNPHFIYNTLNSFQYYILEGNVEASLNHISDFSTLMRSVLENSMHKYITLDEEITFLQKYIRISEQRMTRKLKFRVEVSKDIETSELLIPPMLLQPYLENAIIHGFVESPREPEIVVYIQKKDNRISFSIQDNGIGRAKSHSNNQKMSGSKPKSYGLGILKERMDLLNQLSHYDFQFQIQDLFDPKQNPIGTKVIISFDCIYNRLD